MTKLPNIEKDYEFQKKKPGDWSMTIKSKRGKKK